MRYEHHHNDGQAQSYKQQAQNDNNSGNGSIKMGGEKGGLHSAVDIMVEEEEEDKEIGFTWHQAAFNVTKCYN